MIKKVVVAVAGTGTRMLDLAKDKPKHLIHVLDRPFLAYLLDNLFYAGYTDIILVVGYKGEMIETFIKSYILPISMISQSCPKCRSSRIRRGYRPTSILSKLVFRYHLLCDACNWEFKGFAVPGTVDNKPRRRPNSEAGEKV